MQTNLFQSAAEWNEQFAAEKFDGVICLTDGIDTSGESRQTALEALERTSIPHAFVPMAMQLPSMPFADIIKLESASTAAIGTKVPVSMLVQVSGLEQNQPVEVVVQRDGQDIHRKQIKHFGNATVTEAVTFEVPVAEAKTQVFTASLNSGSTKMADAKWAVQGVRTGKPRILLYQGAMDWGTRHIRGVFDRGDNGLMDVRFHPSVIKGKMSGGSAFPGPRELDAYDVVILMNLKHSQVSDEMAASLTQFVRGGGGLLVLNANPVAAATLASTPLERLLPVKFSTQTPPEDPNFTNPDDFSQRAISSQEAGTLAITNDGSEITLAELQVAKDIVPAMQPFGLTREALANPLFEFVTKSAEPDKALPGYQDRARTAELKAGAVSLAVAKEDSGVLLAMQNFGRGRSALLATDALWRWRLSLPSDSQVFDQFWRQLVGYLGAARQRQAAWILTSAIYQADKPVEVKFLLPSSSGHRFSDMEFELEGPTGKQSLSLSPAGSEGLYRTNVSLLAGKTFRLAARDGKQLVSETYLSGRPGLEGQELRVLKPDLTGLSELAAANQGVMVDPRAGFDWDKWLPPPESESVKIAQVPLWHTPWVFLALLGLFGGELLIRRAFRMV